eukprot:TRINITY_DN20792_c0_g1_i2.p1 TRINITY_DN20792_c0_g1~~TRINITY_DN20792_c0_g1_i2.p1  ORF type:complete len:273 (+),score=65.49 TRINITY_DN20792_c0_g1_i2:213-1031(+)
MQTSKFYAAVQEESERFREPIEALSEEIREFEAGDMSEYHGLLERTEKFLGQLTDEGLVLKNFSWPEDKINSIREALKRNLMLQKVATQQQEHAGMLEALKARQDGELPLDLRDPREVEKWLVQSMDQFTQSSKALDHLKRTLEETRPRYYKHSIPFPFDTLTQVGAGCLLYAKAHMSVILGFIAGHPTSPLRRNMLRRGFEFAFRVQQFANLTDDGATELVEQIFAQLEATHQQTMDQLRSPTPRNLRKHPTPAVAQQLGSSAVLEPIVEE